MPTRTFRVRPNTFFVEKQVTNGQMLFGNHRDFSNASDEFYKMETGKTPNYLVISGSIDSSETIERGRYNLAGGFFKALT